MCSLYSNARLSMESLSCLFDLSVEQAIRFLNGARQFKNNPHSTLISMILTTNVWLLSWSNKANMWGLTRPLRIYYHITTLSRGCPDFRTKQPFFASLGSCRRLFLKRAFGAVNYYKAIGSPILAMLIKKSCPEFRTRLFSKLAIRGGTRI